MIVRRALIQVVSVGLLVIAATAFSGPWAGATPRRCRTQNLAVDQVRFGSAGSFHEYLDMAFVNFSPSVCSLTGWPRIQMLDAHVRPIPIRASRSHPGPAATIALGTWQRAYFTIHFTDAGPCLPHHRVAQGVRVAPPGDSGGQIVPERLDLCALPLPVPIGIDPVRANRGRFPPPF